MKFFKKIIVCLLAVAMLVPAFSSVISAEEAGESVITNGFIIYRYNELTGGFSIETAEGHPKKDTDNNMPLLYEEDTDRSNGTSFVTVRIDGRDYVFGQDYGFFGFDTVIAKPVISEEGRLMTIDWTLKGITVTKKIALTKDAGSDTLGNVGLSFEVKNNSGKSASVGIRLPQDLLGSLVSNAPGLAVSMRINTIDNIYEFAAGVNIRIIECEAVLAFKEVRVRNRDVIVPDKVEFYIHEGLQIPVAPPVLFITGLGGGINGLADTIGGSFTSLPPITLILSTRLKAIGLLEGAFKARISLEGLSLEGALTIDGLEKYLSIEAGIAARWVDPWSLSLYGNVNIIDGVIRGGLSVILAENYFYGYLFANFCIPDSVPLIGGMELGGIEAAVSDEFIGANIKVLGFKYGVIYYWGGDVNFEKNLDLSSPASRSGVRSMSPYMLKSDTSDATSYYGVNIAALETADGPRVALLASRSPYSYADTTVYRAEEQNAILLEIPYTGSGTPVAGDFYLENPDGVRVDLTAADDKGNGSFLVQNRGADGKYIYISVTENNRSAIKSGKWRINYSTENITLGSIKAYGIDEVPELKPDGVKVSYDAITSPFDIAVSWDITAASTKTGEINVYLTEDPDTLEKLRTTDNSGSSLGINVLHLDGVPAEPGNADFKIPDTLDSGTYYTVVTFSTTEGISCAISGAPFVFVNPELPSDVAGVRVEYAGNGDYHVIVTDAANYDYTHYLVEIADTDGTPLENNVNLFPAGDKNMVIGKEAGLVTGKKYIISVRTLREEIIPATATQPETTKRYYGDNIISCAEFTMREIRKPVLVDVGVSFDTAKDYIDTDRIVIDYTFTEPAYVELSLRGQTMTLSDEYKKDWRFVIDGLEDGDYVIDFTAFSLSGDSVTGKDFIATLPDAQLGFSVDTSAPALSLAQTRTQSLDANGSYTAIGKMTVLTDAAGNYTISGMAEATSTLTVDGGTAGIVRGRDGEFTYTGTLSGRSSATHTIKAVDFAGNTSVLTVYVIHLASTELTGLKLKSNGVELSRNEYGEYVLELEYGEELSLCAVGITSAGDEIMFSDDRIGWDVLFGNNLISLRKGETTPANSAQITAAGAGETAVKASLSLTEVETVSRRIATGLDTYVIIRLTNPEAAAYQIKAPETVTLNGVTAKAIVTPATGITAGTLVRVTVSLSGKAVRTGKHIIGLTSTLGSPDITAPTQPELLTTAGGNVSKSLTFTFVMPSYSLKNLVITQSYLPPEQMPGALFTATGASTGILSGVSGGMKYRIGDGEWVNINSGNDIALTGLSETVIGVVRCGTATTADSDEQVITVMKAAKPNLKVTQPSAAGGKGSIATTAAHEYRTSNEWTAATGETVLSPGTYYVRVKASGAVLASDEQTVRINAFVPGKEQMPGALFTATGASAGILSGVSGGMKYRIGGGEWVNITSGNDIVLSGLSETNIYVVKLGTASTADSDEQVITVTKAATPNLKVTQPSVTGGTGSIATTISHEYRTSTEWTAATGATELTPGTYYVRVKAASAVLASDEQTLTINTFIPEKEQKPGVLFTATGTSTGILSGVSDGMKYRIGGGEWVNITSGNDISLSGLSETSIYIVRLGTASTADSDEQVITVTKAATPNLEVTQPSAAGGKGSIATTAAHEYRTSTEWISAAGATELSPGTYYVRVRAAGAVLASDEQTLTINAFVPGADTKRYAVLSGTESVWKKNSGVDLTFTTDGDNSKFTGLTINGSPVGSDDFGNEPDGAVISLDASYLETLSTGDYTLCIQFTDGYAETVFTVSDGSGMPWLWIALPCVVVAGAGISLYFTVIRKKNNRKTSSETNKS